VLTVNDVVEVVHCIYICFLNMMDGWIYVSMIGVMRSMDKSKEAVYEVVVLFVQILKLVQS